MSDLREKILNARDLPSQEMEVPEWNGAKVLIRTMSGKERDEFERFLAGAEEESGPRVFAVMCKLVAICLRDPATGERLYDAAADINKLRVSGEAGKSAGVPGGDSASA
jgi:hypothetical protein